MTDYGLAADEIVIGTSGGVLVAPVGTTLPTTYNDEPNAAFVPLGFLTPGGLSIPTSPEIKEIEAWQSADPIAARMKKRGATVNFELMQWNANTVPFAFGGGSIAADSGDGYVYTPPTSEEVDEYAIIADVLDGTKVIRFVFKRGYPAAGTSPAFNRDNSGNLSVGYKVLTPSDGSEPFFIRSNDDSWDSGS
jgi:hypothetical protein